MRTGGRFWRDANLLLVFEASRT